MSDTEMTADLGAEDLAPQLVPLNAIFATDFVQILVPVTTANTMQEVAAAVAYHVEGRRVRALPYQKVVIYQGERLPASSRSTTSRSSTTSRRGHEEPGGPGAADGRRGRAGHRRDRGGQPRHRDRGRRPRRLHPGAGRGRDHRDRADAAPLSRRGLRDQVVRRDDVRV